MFGVMGGAIFDAHELHDFASALMGVGTVDAVEGGLATDVFEDGQFAVEARALKDDPDLLTGLMRVGGDVVIEEGDGTALDFGKG